MPPKYSSCAKKENNIRIENDRFGSVAALPNPIRPATAIEGIAASQFR